MAHRAQVDDERAPVRSERLSLLINPGTIVRQHRDHQRGQPRHEPRVQVNHRIDVSGRVGRQLTPRGERDGAGPDIVDEDGYAEARVNDGRAQGVLHLLRRGGLRVHDDGLHERACIRPGGVLRRNDLRDEPRGRLG